MLHFLVSSNASFSPGALSESQTQSERRRNRLQERKTHFFALRLDGFLGVTLTVYLKRRVEEYSDRCEGKPVA
jgi:hypothetical protein